MSQTATARAVVPVEHSNRNPSCAEITRELGSFQVRDNRGKESIEATDPIRQAADATVRSRTCLARGEHDALRDHDTHTVSGRVAEH